VRRLCLLPDDRIPSCNLDGHLIGLECFVESSVCLFFLGDRSVFFYLAWAKLSSRIHLIQTCDKVCAYYKIYVFLFVHYSRLVSCHQATFIRCRSFWKMTA